MKQLRTNIRRIAFGLAALFLLLILYGGYSLSNYGSRWFSTNANSYLRSVKKDVIPGNILDRRGTMLAGAEVTAYQDGTFSWERVYAQDEAVRLGTVHALGDSGGKVSNAVESFMASYLYGFKQTVWDRIFDAAQIGVGVGRKPAAAVVAQGIAAVQHQQQEQGRQAEGNPADIGSQLFHRFPPFRLEAGFVPRSLGRGG